MILVILKEIFGILAMYKGNIILLINLPRHNSMLRWRLTANPFSLTFFSFLSKDALFIT